LTQKGFTILDLPTILSQTWKLLLTTSNQIMGHVIFP